MVYLATLPASDWWALLLLQCGPSTIQHHRPAYCIPFSYLEGIWFEIPNLNHLQWDLDMGTPLSSMNLSSLIKQMGIMWGLSKKMSMSILEAVSAGPVQGYKNL